MNDVVELRVPAPEPTGSRSWPRAIVPSSCSRQPSRQGVPFWTLVRANVVAVGEHLLPTVWHAHEMVFDFATVVVGGLLLTAASNWMDQAGDGGRAGHALACHRAGSRVFWVTLEPDDYLERLLRSEVWRARVDIVWSELTAGTDRARRWAR